VAVFWVLLNLLCGGVYKETNLSPNRPLKLMNRLFNVRPIVTLAAKLVGSGPYRLRMVKLSHLLNSTDVEQP
jgi:hypothetical protein